MLQLWTKKSDFLIFDGDNWWVSVQKRTTGIR